MKQYTDIQDLSKVNTGDQFSYTSELLSSKNCEKNYIVFYS